MKPGDKVQWTVVSRRGRVVSMTQKTGVIIALDGETAAVRYGKHGRELAVPVAQLRLIGERSQLTEFVEAVVEANRRKP